MLGALVLTVVWARRPSDGCHVENDRWASVARYGSEYAGAALVEEPFTDPPISNYVISPAFSASNQHAAGLVYRAMSLVFQVNASPIANITVIPGSTSDSSLLGHALFGNATIVMYVANIPNYDAFVAVLIHEMFHFMGFGPIAHAGYTSFDDRTSPLTFEHTSPTVLACAQNIDDQLTTLYADASLYHWNASMDAFRDDMMLPFITFDRTAVSTCSVKEVLVSRPWDHRLCNTDADCSSSQFAHCVKLGRHWPKVCRGPSAHLHGTGRRSGLAQFLVFSGIVVVFFAAIEACRRRPMNLYAPFATKATPPMF